MHGNRRPLLGVCTLCMAAAARSVDFWMEFHSFLWRFEHGVLGAPTPAREGTAAATHHQPRDLEEKEEEEDTME